MKIRIKGDSIRFRLTQTEVKILSENGKIYDSTNFGNVQFSYSVILNANIDNLEASFNNNHIVLKMPKSLGDSWFENDIITFDHTFKTKQGNVLYLLLEKDFTCLDNTIEDQSDNYPNPKLS
ncbi:DUF7009 family protein [Maribacter sp. ACAM166]|uniref:DUF7009 family protein n=1 Tax=Maribacter sp. ACAM166 TaxID=2508996 RepID=UPI0010FE768B|nr:hypothetical protein [Maribacter sp. ACAM166]TLP74496.1 hypothetical protein ES765_15740 [Maribacter sp. ACAM166]